jgi:hypothetical protein
MSTSTTSRIASPASLTNDLASAFEQTHLSAQSGRAHETASDKTVETDTKQVLAPTRHGFKIAFEYIDIAAKDEVRDRGGRDRDSLLWGKSKESSTIYRARHWRPGSSPPSDVVHLPLGEGEEEDEPADTDSDSEDQSSLVEDDHGYSIPDQNYTLYKIATRNRNIEEGLLTASKDRVNDKILDIRPSGDMSRPDQALWEEVLKDIVQDMQNPSTLLGQLVDKIKIVHHRKEQRGVDALAREFTEFCNLVAERLSQALRRGPPEHIGSGIFRTFGTFKRKDNAEPNSDLVATKDNSPAIIVHVENAVRDAVERRHDALGFGEVQKMSSCDLTDKLLGAILRQSVSPLFWFAAWKDRF